MKVPKKNPLEWTVFGVSIIIVVFVLGYLIYDSTITDGDAIPVVNVSLGEVTERNGQYIVPVTVSNSSDKTAEGVKVLVSVEKDGKAVEESEFDTPYVPRGSQSQGFVVFSKNPKTEGELKATVKSYEEP